MCRPAYLIFALLSTSNSATSSQQIPESNTDSSIPLNDNECSLYLAQSSIPGAGFGLFTTRDVQNGEGILPYSDAPTIPICDVKDVEHTDWVHHSYVWQGMALAKFECAAVSESIVSFGSLCNYHTYLVNAEGHPEGYDYEAVDRFVHPSAGAFSYHKGQHFKATRTITAGEELFVDYGSSWLDSREGTFADYVPRNDDFVKAAEILLIMRETYLNSTSEINDGAISTFIHATRVFDDRVASLIPDTKAKYEAVENHLYEDSLYAMAIAKSTVINRGVNWIKENGLCMDNILPGKSTIPLIGQGGFANRFLVEGSVISPAPLLQITNSDIMLTYEDKDDTPSGMQLLVNYCFGHKDSKLLLCPQSNAILINHCSSRKNGVNYCGDKGPNAKIRWASGWDPNTPIWLEMSLDQISAKSAAKSRGLSFEVIATRDIKSDEEIFLDYGPNWEDAWELHRNEWKPHNKGTKFGDYNPLNSERSKVLLRTIDELKKTPYPDDIFTACYWYEWVEEGYNPDERGYYMADDYISKDNLDTLMEIWPCDILEKMTDTHYEVRIIREYEEDVLLTMFPQESITFRMKQYTSDQHLPGAFRHYIEIEDSMFPEQWKMSYDDA